MRFLRVPVDIQRRTGYSHAYLYLTAFGHTRIFTVRWLRAR